MHLSIGIRPPEVRRLLIVVLACGLFIYLSRSAHQQRPDFSFLLEDLYDNVTVNARRDGERYVECGRASSNVCKLSTAEGVHKASDSTEREHFCRVATLRALPPPELNQDSCARALDAAIGATAPMMIVGVELHSTSHCRGAGILTRHIDFTEGGGECTRRPNMPEVIVQGMASILPTQRSTASSPKHRGTLAQWLPQAFVGSISYIRGIIQKVWPNTPFLSDSLITERTFLPKWARLSTPPCTGIFADGLRPDCRPCCHHRPLNVYWLHPQSLAVKSAMLPPCSLPSFFAEPIKTKFAESDGSSRCERSVGLPESEDEQWTCPYLHVCEEYLYMDLVSSAFESLDEPLSLTKAQTGKGRGCTGVYAMQADLQQWFSSVCTERAHKNLAAHSGRMSVGEVPVLQPAYPTSLSVNDEGASRSNPSPSQTSLPTRSSSAASPIPVGY